MTLIELVSRTPIKMFQQLAVIMDVGFYHYSAISWKKVRGRNF